MKLANYVSGHWSEGLGAGELHETAFQGVERDLALGPEEVSQKLPVGQLFRFDCLGNALVEPLRTTSARKLANEGVR